MSAPEITEADVVAWLTARAQEHAKEFGGYGVIYASSLFHGEGMLPDVAFTVGSGKLLKNHVGKTLDEARIAARSENPEGVAAKKREMAARLLAEAEALEGKR